MSDKVLRIIGCDIGPGGDQYARGFRSTKTTLLNKEGALDSNGGSRSRALHGKKRWRPWRRQLDKGGKNKTDGIDGRAAYCAERVRLMQYLANTTESKNRRYTRLRIKVALGSPMAQVSPSRSLIGSCGVGVQEATREATLQKQRANAAWAMVTLADCPSSPV